MSPPPADDSRGSTDPPDRQTLRLLERILGDEPVVDVIEFDPNVHEPQQLRASFDTDRYPSPVVTASLDLRWFTSGDFSVHYVETMEDGERWECRWDRHPNAHNSRLHFHQPPDGSECDDFSLSSLHPIDVVSTVLAAVENRIDDLWTATETGT